MRGAWGFIVGLALLTAVGSLKAHDDLSSDKRQRWPEKTFVSQGVNFNDVMYQYDICGQDLYKANKDAFDAPSASYIKQWEPKPERFTRYSGSSWLRFDVDKTIVIPAHESCFDVITLPNGMPADFELTYNICYEDYALYVPPPQGTLVRVYVPHTVLPCYNEQRQRLRFYDEARYWLDTPYYTTEAWIGIKSDEMANTRYCLRDLYRNNPQIGGSSAYWIAGSQVIFVGNVPRCQLITVKSDVSLYDISRQYNICMELIQPVSIGGRRQPGAVRPKEYTFDIPEKASDCYDEEGHRIGRDDREVYETNMTESLIDVAKAHQVCVQDLIKANPHVTLWPYVENYSRHVFIPNTPPCDFTTVTHITHEGDDLLTLSFIYNVCFNRLYDANLPLLTKYGFNPLPVGSKITIPNRPPCYVYSFYCGGRYRQPAESTCYNEPIDFDKDYTGTEPPISAVPFQDRETCYTLRDGGKVIYNNQTLTLFKRGLSWSMLASCYGITVENMVEANAMNYPLAVRPEGWIVIPHPRRHCEFENPQAQDLWSAGIPRVPPHWARTGQLDDKGVYVVRGGDTLNDIGKRFGYLPSMIAAENGLETPYIIYPYQELQMPHMPSLYDIGKAVLYVGGVGAGLMAFGLYRMRRRIYTKKKQKPAA